jgi:hypothetical protein
MGTENFGIDELVINQDEDRGGKMSGSTKG